MSIYIWVYKHWTCTQYARWEDSEGLSLQETGHQQEGTRVASSSLYRHLQKEYESNGHGHWEVGRYCQRFLMVDTQFTPRARVRRGEMKACHWGEACSTERKQSNIRGEHLQMHSLQQRLSLLCRPDIAIKDAVSWDQWMLQTHKHLLGSRTDKYWPFIFWVYIHLFGSEKVNYWPFINLSVSIYLVDDHYNVVLTPP